MNDNNLHSKSIKLWKSIVTIVAVFSFVICILIVANYFQISKKDPVDVKILNSLVERLNQNPDDDALRNEVREFDLLARKAYFTSQWQIRTGGYLLLISIIILIIALQIIDSYKKKIPAVVPKGDEKYLISQKKARTWIYIGGALIVGLSLLFAYLSHQKMQSNFETTDENVILDENIAEDTSKTIEEIIEVPDTASLDTVSIDSTEVTNGQVFRPAKMKKHFSSFRGPGGNGIAYSKNVPTDWDGASNKNILWKTAIPVHGYNSPIIWGSYVFLSGANASKQQVYCYNANNGKLIWAVDVKNVPGSPAKAPKTTEDTGLAAPSLCSDGTGVYAIFGTGDIIALDMSGKELWSKNLGVPDNHYGHSSSLYVYDDKLIVQYDHKKSQEIMALSTTTGEKVWSTSRKAKVSWASPIIVNTGSRDEIMLLTDPFAASYDPNTGKELWKIDCTYGEVGPSLCYANGLVFGMNEYAKLVAIDITGNPKILWEDNEYLSDVPSPVATDKYLFVVTSYGVVVCYDARAGKILWDNDFGGNVYSSPIIVEDKLYIIDRKGVMHIMKVADTYELIAEPKLGEESVCTPAFADGRIYIRAGNNLYCIGGK